MAKLANPFETNYLLLTQWIDEYGWIELGSDEYSSSLIRVLNEGGMVWEGKSKYRTLDDAFRAAEKAIAEWIEENG